MELIQGSYVVQICSYISQFLVLLYEMNMSEIAFFTQGKGELIILQCEISKSRVKALKSPSHDN